jgi:hypothetical protein
MREEAGSCSEEWASKEESEAIMGKRVGDGERTVGTGARDITESAMGLPDSLRRY